jgi:GTP cyclohydrolase I
LKFDFKYFIDKISPVTAISAPMCYDCTFEAVLDNYNEEDEEYRFFLGVKVPVTTLCPCSKEISSYGAHNQRAFAKIEIVASEMVWLEELVEIADAGASSPVYGLLKRPDEKFVTEMAYDNPRFVEDAVREIALRLEEDTRISWYRCEVESVESIHNHNAFAVVEKGWK